MQQINRCPTKSRDAQCAPAAEGQSASAHHRLNISVQGFGRQLQCQAAHLRTMPVSTSLDNGTRTGESTATESAGEHRTQNPLSKTAVATACRSAIPFRCDLARY